MDICRLSRWSADQGDEGLDPIGCKAAFLLFNLRLPYFSQHTNLYRFIHMYVSIFSFIIIPSVNRAF